MEERPKVGLGVCVVQDKKVLLGKRMNAHGEGSWCFPGGHLEFGESWEECAERETLEEAGIRIKDICFMTATNDLFPAEKKHYVTVIMRAEYDSGDVRVMEVEKCLEWGWFDWTDLPEPLFVPIRNLVLKGFDPLSDMPQGQAGNMIQNV